MLCFCKHGDETRALGWSNTGSGEQVNISTGRRLTAEGLGTGILVTAVVGSGIMAERLAGGHGAVALLCNAVPTGAILFVPITVLTPV
jgi:glycerol uptake facilitator-like aquaporin